MNLFEKIQLVSNEVRTVEKDMNVANQYKAVSDLAVTLAVKDAELKHKLISIPVKVELINSEVYRNVDTVVYEIHKADGTIQTNTTNTVKATYIDTIKMTVKIIDLENPTNFIEIESFGRGLDTGDKGFGKASTYARKYALLNVYKIATGEDPDKDPSPDNKNAAPTTTQPTPTAKVTPTAPQHSHVAPPEAYTEVSACKTIDELLKVSLKYKFFATDLKFVDAGNKKKIELTPKTK